jgi:hypothetical protein
MYPPGPEHMGNASTVCLVHTKRYTQYDSFETKKYYFSAFSCDMTDTFVMGLIYVKLAKKDRKLCISLTNYHKKCLVKLNKGNNLGYYN